MFAKGNVVGAFRQAHGCGTAADPTNVCWHEGVVVMVPPEGCANSAPAAARKRIAIRMVISPFGAQDPAPRSSARSASCAANGTSQAQPAHRLFLFSSAARSNAEM